MRMRRGLFMAGVIVISSVAILPGLQGVLAGESQAPVAKPEDFAYGIDIDAPAGGPVYELDLSEEVYRGVMNEDLRDLRVFNSQGEPVPYGLQHRVAEHRQSTVLQTIRFFPIEGDPAQATGGNVVEVREDASGKVAQVRFSGPSGSEPPRALGYLLDLRGQQRALRSLELEWSSSEPSRVIPVRVEGSDDLVSWRALTGGAVLANLAFQNGKLEQKRIELPEVRSSYLRIIWTGDAPFKLESVAGEFVSDQRIEAARGWAKVPGQLKLPAPGGKRAQNVRESEIREEYLFDSQAVRPADSIRIRLPETNLYLRIRLYSGRTVEGPWLERFVGTAYRLTVEGAELASSPIILSAPVSDRFWLVGIEDRGMPLGARLPELELGWVPHRLCFLGRGSAPFRLVYGSATAEAVDYGLASVMEFLKAAGNGQAVIPQPARLTGGPKELGGAARLAPPPEVREFPWTKWALWMLLSFAMLMIARMAWRLYRDLSVGKH